jgi:hypothetical protein
MVARFRDGHFPLPPRDAEADGAEVAGWNGYIRP